MPLDDPKSHATSKLDFYGLLEIKSTASESEIKRGYRRAALKYHPDKVGDDEEAKQKFQDIQIANDVLLDPEARRVYDAAREKIERDKRQREQLEAGRKRMVDELEAAERGTKRVKIVDGYEDDAVSLERKLNEIRAANRERMQKKEQVRVEDLERQVREDKEQEEREKQENADEQERNGAKVRVGGTEVPALERTVKVRWRREGLGIALDGERLSSLFSRFGQVEHARSNREKDKKQRIGETREKKVVATGFVIFASVVGAHAAVEDFERIKGKNDEWDIMESVQWQQEPSFGKNLESSPPPTHVMPSTPSSAIKSGARPRFPGVESSTPSASNGNGLKKVPSFASFSGIASGTPKASPATNRFGPSSPSLEELTLMKLKNKEKERKKLIEQLEKEERRDGQGI